MTRKLYTKLVETIKEMTKEQLVGVQEEIALDITDDMTDFEVMIHGLADAFLQGIIESKNEFPS